MNLKYEVGQSVAIEVPKTITETITEIISAEIKSITICASGAKYLTSKGAFTEEQLDSYAQPAREEPAQTEPKFKVGDTVKIASVRPNTWNTQGKMDEHLGKVVKITAIYGGNYFKFAGSEPWRFCLNDVEPYAEPAQPKAEPIKLYCVKNKTDVGDYSGCLTVGKIYEFDGHYIEYDKLTSVKFEDFDHWKKGDRGFASCLIPLVSRPAEVGEWVYIRHAMPLPCQSYQTGDIFKVTENNVICVGDVRVDGLKSFIDRLEYLVLDGYKPEPEAEPEPEYYNGKVVCVHNGGFINLWTVGKVYGVIEGKITYNNGDVAGMRIGSFADFEKRFAAKFIEFKGE